jgi:DNA-directed RNA polymerase specialized sigma24 family protein
VQIEEDRDFENLVSESADNSAAAEGDPESILTEKLTGEDVSSSLAAAVAALEPEDRLILKLYYFDDLRLKQIADMFGYHEATASRKLVRVQNDIRKSVERSLRETHGWSDTEVQRYLSDSAAELGISFEKLLVMLIVIGLLQDLWT